MKRYVGPALDTPVVYEVGDRVEIIPADWQSTDDAKALVGVKGTVWKTEARGGSVINGVASTQQVHVELDAGHTWGTDHVKFGNASLKPVPVDMPAVRTFVGMVTDVGGYDNFEVTLPDFGDMPAVGDRVVVLAMPRAGLFDVRLEANNDNAVSGCRCHGAYAGDEHSGATTKVYVGGKWHGHMTCDNPEHITYGIQLAVEAWWDMAGYTVEAPTS